MAKIVDIKRPDGTPGKGIELDFTVKREEWNEYLLSNGTLLRVKNSLVRVYLEVDENGNPQTTEEGEPSIIIRHSTSVVARDSED
jgi:hypothetical protein